MQICLPACAYHIYTCEDWEGGKDLFWPTLPGHSPSWQYRKPWQQEPGGAGRCVCNEAAEA